MAKINYNNKVFKSLVNDSHGHVSSNTTFYYKQKGRILWGTYEGGTIEMGTITGKVLDDGKLVFNFQHLTTSGELKSGFCESTPEVRSTGRIRLFERWKWTCDDFAEGMSIVEEVVN